MAKPQTGTVDWSAKVALAAATAVTTMMTVMAGMIVLRPEATTRHMIGITRRTEELAPEASGGLSP
jgi:hypothetical protein